MQTSSSAASSSQHLLQGSGQASSVKQVKYAFHPSQMRSWPSPRPSNWLENRDMCKKKMKNASSLWSDV
eukprot:422663-Ditylum_brightwellii.AAC.1